MDEIATDCRLRRAISVASADGDLDTDRIAQGQGTKQMSGSTSHTASTRGSRITSASTDEQEDDQSVSSRSTTSRTSSRFPVTDAYSRLGSRVSTRTAPWDACATGARPSTSGRSDAERSALVDLIPDSDNRRRSRDFLAAGSTSNTTRTAVSIDALTHGFSRLRSHRSISDTTSANRTQASTSGQTVTGADSRSSLGLSRSVGKDEVSLGGYLLARQVDRRPVDLQDQALLRIANSAVTRTRATIPYRGNVDVDLQTSELESLVRERVASRLTETLLRGRPMHPDSRSNIIIQSALASRVSGGGNCQEYAANSSLAYGTEALTLMRPSSEEIHIVARRNKDHGWAEVRPSSEQSVVMDAWADGPAVLAEDSHFAKDRDDLVSLAQFDLASASRGDSLAGRGAQMMLETRGARVQEHFRKAREEIHSGQIPCDNISSPQRVIEDHFANRVRDTLSEAATRQARHGDWSASVIVDVRAVSVAKSLGSSGVSTIVNDARRIRQELDSLVSSRGRSTLDDRSNSTRSRQDSTLSSSHHSSSRS